MFNENKLSKFESLGEFCNQRKYYFNLKSDISIEEKLLKDAIYNKKLNADQIDLNLLTKSKLQYYQCEVHHQHGTFHQIYICKKKSSETLVLKKNLLSSELIAWPFLIEERVSKVLKENQIPHAEILYTDCSRKFADFDFQISKLLEGQRFSDFDDNDEIMGIQLIKLSNLFKSLHEIQGEGFGLLNAENFDQNKLYGSHSSWKDYIFQNLHQHLQYIAKQNLLTDKEIQDINHLFKFYESEINCISPRLLHGDCGNHNIFLISVNVVGMIDWEDALLGDPLFEIALWATFQPVRRWHYIFNTYFYPGWKPNLLFWLYYLRISIAKSVLRSRFNYKDKPGFSKASSRIQNSLIEIYKIQESL